MRWDIILPIVIALLVAFAIVAVARRAFRLVFVAIALAILIPAATAIMCGEGESYIDKFSSLFAPAVQQTIKDGYQDYAQKEKENPILDRDGINSALDDLWNATKDKVTDIVQPSPDESEGHIIPYSIAP